MGGRPRQRDDADGGRDWIVLIDRLPAYVELDGRALKPWASFWVEAATESGLGLDLAATADELDLADGYALARSAAGAAPRRIRCAGQAVATELRRALPSGIPIHDDGEADPALADLADRLVAAAADELGVGASLLGAPPDDPDRLDRFHAAAAALHAAVRAARLERALAIAVPLDPPPAPPTTVVVTIGGHLVLGEPTLTGISPDVDLPAGATPDGRHGMLAFLGPADLGGDGWTAAVADGRRLADADAVPDLFHVDDDGVVRPLAERDVDRAIAAADAIRARLSAGPAARG